MSKPATAYTKSSKPVTSFNITTKPATDYSKKSKDTTGYSKVAKNSVSFDSTQGAEKSWRLDSTIVKLDDNLYLLSGYTDETPNQLSNKPKTAYGVV